MSMHAQVPYRLLYVLSGLPSGSGSPLSLHFDDSVARARVRAGVRPARTRVEYG